MSALVVENYKYRDNKILIFMWKTQQGGQNLHLSVTKVKKLQNHSNLQLPVVVKYKKNNSHISNIKKWNLS